MTPARSSKPSGGKHAQRRPRREPVFFVDQSVPSPAVHQGLRAVGFKIEILIDHFPNDVDDDEWLEFVGSHRWFAIGRDKGISKNPMLVEAVNRNRVGYFVLAYKHDVSAKDQLEILKNARVRMLRVTSEYKRPFIAKIDSKGGVRVSVGEKIARATGRW